MDREKCGAAELVCISVLKPSQQHHLHCSYWCESKGGLVTQNTFWEAGMFSFKAVEDVTILSVRFPVRMRYSWIKIVTFGPRSQSHWLTDVDTINRHNMRSYTMCIIWPGPAWSTRWLWKALIAADQTKWTPALCQAPVCLKWSGQSEHAAIKWMHSLCPGSDSPSPSFLSLLCSLWVI